MKNLKIVATIIFLFICNSSLAQSNITYSLWYEYGDGNFLINSFVEETDLNNYVGNLPPVGSGTYLGMQKIVQHYAPKPPPSLSINSNSKRINAEGYTSGEFVSLTNDLEMRFSTNDFISNDTIHLALHYDKKDYPSATQVGFFYNSNGNQTFIPFLNLTGSFPIIDEATGEVSQFPQSRIHNSENISLPSNAMLNNVNTPSGGTYQNGLLYKLSSEGNKSSNIFITLFTFENIEIDDDENFKLVFFDKNGNQLNTNNQDVTNHSKLKSHDPNYEKVKPNCIEINTINNTIANYDVHFQNIGAGPAESVVTRTELPDNYTVNDIVNWNMTSSSGITNWAIGGINNNSAYNTTVSSENSGKILKIEFLRKPAMPSPVSASDPSRSPSEVLVGTKLLPNPLNDKRTMGEFQFQLKIKKPTIAPLDLVSFTNIVFDNNAAVRTDDAIIRIRNCCKCKEKDSNNTQDANDNKPCKSKSKFLQWLFCKDC